MNSTEDALARVTARARMATAEAAVTSAIYESARSARDLRDNDRTHASERSHARDRIGIASQAADEADTWARCAYASEQTMLETETPTDSQIESARRVTAHARDAAYIAEKQLRELREMLSN